MGSNFCVILIKFYTLTDFWCKDMYCSDRTLLWNAHAILKWGKWLVLNVRYRHYKFESVTKLGKNGKLDGGPTVTYVIYVKTWLRTNSNCLCIPLPAERHSFHFFRQRYKITLSLCECVQYPGGLEVHPAVLQQANQSHILSLPVHPTALFA